MRDALLASCPLLVWIITAVQALLMLLAFRGWKRAKEPLYLLTALVALGLFYDALILSLGTLMQGGPALASLSRMRYVAHGALIPLLFPICGYALDLKKPVMNVLWIVTAVLMAAGAAQAFFTVLEPKEIAGVVRYVSGADTPKWADMISRILSFGTVIPMMIAGVFVWIRQKTPYLFLSGFLMFVFSALGPATGNMDLIFFISMFGELFMVLFLYLYAERK